MRKEKRREMPLAQVDDRIISVGQLFPDIGGWWVQADCQTPNGRDRTTYTADGPFANAMEGRKIAHEVAAEMGWAPGSYMVTVDE